MTGPSDERTHFLLRDDGIVRGSMGTADEAVREWAGTTHDRCWAEADPVTPADR